MLFRSPHIDSYFDLKLPKNLKAKSLSYMALDHGYVHFGAHQALSDVFACAHILSQYRINETIKIAETPLIEIITENSYREYGASQERKKLLYELGFRWHPETKTYRKTLREFYLEEIKSKIGNCHITQIFPEKPYFPPSEQSLELPL